MSKYNITIHAMSTESFPFTCNGEIDGRSFESATIIYNGGPIWKVKEHGMLPAPTSMSEFTRGERSAIAAWAKKCEQNPQLVGQASMMASAMGLAPKRQQAQAVNQSMKNELDELRAMVALLLKAQGGDEPDAEDADEDSEEDSEE